MTHVPNWMLSDHLQVRELVNGLWFAVSFAMCVEFGKTLIQRLYNNHHKWRYDLGTKAIVALFVYFLGETLMRGWIWLLLALHNSGHEELSMEVRDEYYIAFIAAMISMWGAMCCLYVFSKNHWVWLRAATIVLLFVMVTTIVF